MNLDYSLSTSEERTQYVANLLAADEYDAKTLTQLSDYILFVNERGHTKGHTVITKNREATIKKRETSYEGMALSLEGGEDALHTLINNDKVQLLDRKDKITQEDIDNNPLLKQQAQVINTFNAQLQTTTDPAKRKKIKKWIIETWQQMYLIKTSSKSSATSQVKTIAHLSIPETITLTKDNIPLVESPLSLLIPDHISFLLSYYSILKQETYDELENDMRWLLLDLENLIDRTFKGKNKSTVSNSVLYDLVIWKIDGRTGKEIQELMEINHNEIHTEQYYSTLWKQHIPRLLARQAQKDYLTWYYSNISYGSWKQCTKCGEWKVASSLFFNHSPATKDGYYPQCKDCRSTR